MIYCSLSAAEYCLISLQDANADQLSLSVHVIGTYVSQSGSLDPGASTFYICEQIYLSNCSLFPLPSFPFLR